MYCMIRIIGTHIVQFQPLMTDALLNLLALYECVHIIIFCYNSFLTQLQIIDQISGVYHIIYLQLTSVLNANCLISGCAHPDFANVLVTIVNFRRLRFSLVECCCRYCSQYRNFYGKQKRGSRKSRRHRFGVRIQNKLHFALMRLPALALRCVLNRN